MESWPGRSTLSPAGEPNPRPLNLLEWPSSELLEPNHASARTCLGPLSRALRPSDAKMAAPRAFRMSNELSDIGTLSVGTGFEVWERREHKAGSLTHGLAAGARLGPLADGSLLHPLPTPPPGLRRSSLREVPSLWAAPALARLPPGMISDESLRYSAVTHQFFWIPFFIVAMQKSPSGAEKYALPLRAPRGILSLLHSSRACRRAPLL